MSKPTPVHPQGLRQVGTEDGLGGEFERSCAIVAQGVADIDPAL
jgi:hypothetical protein